MASAQAWRIKKQWASKFEEFLRTSSAGHLAVSLIRGDCVYDSDLLRLKAADAQKIQKTTQVPIITTVIIHLH